MDIYQARKLQKELYKEIAVKYKFMKTVVFNNKLCYFIGCKVADDSPIEIDLKRIIPALDYLRQNNVHLLIDFLTEEKIEKAIQKIRSSPGVYVLEYIEID